MSMNSSVAPSSYFTSLSSIIHVDEDGRTDDAAAAADVLPMRSVAADPAAEEESLDSSNDGGVTPLLSDAAVVSNNSSLLLSLAFSFIGEERPPTALRFFSRRELAAFAPSFVVVLMVEMLSISYDSDE